MKIGPVSGDLLIKLGLALGLGLGLWYVGKKTVSAVSDTAEKVFDSVVDTVAEGAKAIDPRSTDNVIYTTVNKVTGGDDSNSLGGRIYDFFHPNVFNPKP